MTQFNFTRTRNIHRRLFRRLAMLTAVFFCAAANTGQADVIETLYSSSPANPANGGAVYFDINVLTDWGITVERISTNTDDSFTNGTMSVFARTGTYAGFETNIAGWTLVSTGTGNGAGINNPSVFDVTDFDLRPGVFGIAIVSDAARWGHRYTNGNGSNQFYSNGDVSLTLGSAKDIPFATQGITFSPRVWNGSIEYTPIPEPTHFVLLGIALVGVARRRR